ncbi:caspase-1-like [Coccinella septempunctata]|uniref:caspase-1-like n=1 Tax=Coccinella septempunctata TaxID=41139 RepID=UPI001D087FFC|nr:caspase-1-like [Coccinella septempunctata]
MADNNEEDAISFHPKRAHPVPQDEHGSSLHPQELRYNMNHPKRGMALIFNHMNFSSNLPTRQGTNKDRDDLESLFTKLKFKVKCHNDLTKEQIRSVLSSVALADHTDEDCLVVVILSHGDNRKIFASDTHYTPELLWMSFDGIHSPGLIGKPKLFFIQACRGERVDLGVQFKHTTAVDSTKREDRFISIPVMADILVMYSTVEDFLSWRNPKSGSYFIQSLVRQLSAHANEKDLLSILTYVNREIATGYSPEMEQQKIQIYANKQMSSIVSMLTKEIYFT